MALLTKKRGEFEEVVFYAISSTILQHYNDSRDGLVREHN
jgi:hypothetical protein